MCSPGADIYGIVKARIASAEPDSVPDRLIRRVKAQRGILRTLTICSPGADVRGIVQARVASTEVNSVPDRLRSAYAPEPRSELERLTPFRPMSQDP